MGLVLVIGSEDRDLSGGGTEPEGMRTGWGGGKESSCVEVDVDIELNNDAAFGVDVEVGNVELEFKLDVKLGPEVGSWEGLEER